MANQIKKTKTFNHNNKYWPIIVVLLGFWFLFFVLYALKTPIHQAMSSIIDLKSEYTVQEQLSKFYAFIIILIAINSYKVLNNPTKIKISICFLVFALTLYLSESNMITEEAQPIFALIILAYIFFLLFKSRSWFVLLLLLMGNVVISGGVLLDLVFESESISSVLTQPVVNFLRLGMSQEELFDLVGMGIICTSAIIYFLDPLRKFAKSNKAGVLCLLVASGMITIGNGFLHWQFKPYEKLVFAALIITIGGFLGLILTNRYIIKEKARLTLITEENFYFFIFSFFVVLPTVFGRISIMRSFVLWLPTMISLGVYLYFRHPLQRNSENKDPKLLNL